MKTFVLTISTKFPQTHPCKGMQTWFFERISTGQKIHTIRANYELWEKRIAEINAGRAVLSVRAWQGKPYRSPQHELFEYTSVGIEKLRFYSNREFSPIIVDGECFTEVSTFKLAENDGLSKEDFVNWFKGYDLSKPMAIIHFTNFRYF